MAKIYQESVDKRNRGPVSVIGNIEFRGKSMKTDYVPYLAMIKGTIRNEEL